jgi:hypothetical protein
MAEAEFFLNFPVVLTVCIGRSTPEAVPRLARI